MIKRLLLAALLALSTVPAHAACWQWSTTAEDNSVADPSINWAEGMSPSSVNDSARAMMARSAECRDDLSGKNATAGTATAYTLTSSQSGSTPLASVPDDGQSISFTAHVTNGAAPTLRVDGGTVYPIQTTSGTAVGIGALTIGSPYTVKFSVANSAWMLHGFYTSTLNIPDGSVPYRKIVEPSTTSLLLGMPSIAEQTISTTANNGSGLIRLTVASTTGYTTGMKKSVAGVVGTTEANGYWTITVVDATHIDLQGSTFANAYVSGGQIGGYVEEITLGTGLQMDANTLSAPAFPPPSLFKNLAIKVASNTTATVTADFVTVTDGTLYKSAAVNCTINFATTGINGLDTGSVASATWYAVWVNLTTAGVSGCTASLQGTANGTFLANRPSGYTYYARVGWVRTAPAIAQLMGTWQLGKQAFYKLGLAQTAIMPLIAQGPIGTPAAVAPVYSSVSISNFFPSTASAVDITAVSNYANLALGWVQLASNTSYGGHASTIPPVYDNANAITQGSNTVRLILEGTTVAATLNSNGAGLVARGWEDNL